MRQPAELEPVGENQVLYGLRLSPLTPEAEKRKKILVGGILFDKGRSLIVVANNHNRLESGHVDVQRHPEVLSQVQDTRRLITLNNFNGVGIRQVGLEAVQFEKPPSMSRSAPLTIHFNARLLGKDQAEPFSVGEDQLLSIFTGERGGIVRFHGEGFPEETGLLFERGGKEKRADILFIHPEHASGVNSIQGLEVFLKQVRGELTQDRSIQLQEQALSILDGYMTHGLIDFGPDIRKEIFKMQILAHARKISSTTGRGTILQELLPAIGRRTRRSKVPKDYSIGVDKIIDTVLIDFTNPLPSEDPEKKPLDELLQTERGHDYLKTFTHEISIDNVEGQERLIHQLRLWIKTVTDINETDDIKLLINYMFEHIDDGETINLPRIQDGTEVDEVGTFPTAEIKIEMLDELRKKRADLIEQTERLFLINRK